MSNQEIIEQYYRQHRDELLQFVGSRLGASHGEQAEDMVQELFLRLLQGQRPIAADTIGSLATTMARNMVADHFRHLYYQRAYEAHARYAGSEGYEVEPVVYAHDIMHRIDHCLSRMPLTCAEAYRLHLYDGMRVSEIARVLQQDYKAVEYRLGQARREVRRQLKSS
ncbi:MAG: sigma-70 family RNA polymerase sigma factor [Prevotella sp.]|nr:sigma-70 family RNA polymerase sigma factor [Prevotella sp.]